MPAAFFAAMRRTTVGLFRIDNWAIGLGPLTFLRFSAPRQERHGWWWEIEGGLLAEPGRGGRLEVTWDQGELRTSVIGYRPRLPWIVYHLTQRPLHVALTRLILLDLRGRLPPAGIPATLPARLGAASIDLAICAVAGVWLGRRGHPLLGAALAATYHVVSWRLGATPGGWLLGLRTVAVDGRRPTTAQAVIRLLTAPLAWIRLRAVHDEIALTQVITRSGS